MRLLRVLMLASAAALGGVTSAAAQGANPAAPAAAAPSAESIAVAKELVSVLSGDLINDMNSKMVAQAWPPTEQALRKQYPQIDAATIAEMHSEFERFIATNMAEAMSDAPEIYARYLTVQEMREIQAFYRTPTGAKTLKVMPQIMSDTMRNLMPRVQGIMQHVQVSMTDILQKHGYGPK